MSISSFVSEDTPIPTCGAGSAASAVTVSSGEGSVCQDPYGNTYNVTYGTKQYVGKVTKRAVTSNVNECLLLCNLETNCVGANYVGDDCTLFRYVLLALPQREYLLTASQRNHRYHNSDYRTARSCRDPTTRCQHYLYRAASDICDCNAVSTTRLWQFEHFTRVVYI